MFGKNNFINKTQIHKKITKWKLKAFTLAEVLITLVIIGVVAAFTIPVLTASYNEKEVIGRVKKTYSMFSNAMNLAIISGGDFDTELADNNDEEMTGWFNQFLKPKLNTVKVCINEAGCWNNGDTYAYNGSTITYNRHGKGIGDNTINVVLADGTLLNIDTYNASDMKKLMGIETEGLAGMVIFFDINGARNPNKLGKDIFVMNYVPETGMVLPYRDKKPYDCTKTGDGYSCINKYLNKT